MGLLGGLNDIIHAMCWHSAYISMTISYYFYSYLHSGQAGIKIDLYCLSTESGAHGCIYKPTKSQRNWGAQGTNDGRFM